MKKLTILILLWLVLFFPIKVFAQDSTELSDLYIDLSPSNVSAFKLLDINKEPIDITEPSKLKEFSINLLTQAAVNYGNVIPGLAIEWAPFLSFKKINKDKKVSTEDKLKLDLATVEDSSSAKLALGFYYLIMDKANIYEDPIYLNIIDDYQKRYLIESPLSVLKIQMYRDKLTLFLREIEKRESVDININTVKENLKFPQKSDAIIEINENDKFNEVKTIIDSNITDTTLNQDDITMLKLLVTEYVQMIKDASEYSNKSILNELKNYIQEYKKSNWNAPSLDFGAGLVYNSDDKTLKMLKLSSITITSTGGFPFGESYQLIGQLTIKHSPSSSNNPEKYNFSSGVKFLGGGYSLRVSLAGLFSYSETYSKQIDRGFKLYAGSELRIADGIWLEIGLGEKGDATKSFNLSKFFSFANVKYTFNKESKFWE